jgi:hypothetical protein
LNPCTCAVRPCPEKCRRCRECDRQRSQRYYADKRAAGMPVKQSTRTVVCIRCGVIRSAGGNDKSNEHVCRECKRLDARPKPNPTPPIKGSVEYILREETMSCMVCGVEEHDPILYRRGRSGRPYQRMCRMLRQEGTNICWICGQPIDIALHQSHPWSWTLDHVLPLIDYPCLGLEPTNHREAHRTCNSRKGKGLAPKKSSTRNSRIW